MGRDSGRTFLLHWEVRWDGLRKEGICASKFKVNQTCGIVQRLTLSALKLCCGYS
jgi:hypothetical protein